MNKSKDFRGYYCKRCHTYTRLYKDEGADHYRGKCPKCRIEIALEAGIGEVSFFFTGGQEHRRINLWDSYRQGKIIGKVDKGTRAKVLGKNTYNGVTWYHVRAGDKTGWVSGTFIRHL